MREFTASKVGTVSAIRTDWLVRGGCHERSSHEHPEGIAITKPWVRWTSDSESRRNPGNVTTNRLFERGNLPLVLVGGFAAHQHAERCLFIMCFFVRNHGTQACREARATRRTLAWALLGQSLRDASRDGRYPSADSGNFDTDPR